MQTTDKVVDTAVSATTETGGAIMSSLGGFFNSIQEGVGQYGLKIVGGIVALIIGLWIVKMIMKAIKKAFDKSKVDSTLKPFLVTLVNFLLKVLLFISIAGIVGIPTATFAALLAAVGLAIGGAFNGSLGHMAAGVMLLVFRPFKVGDLIETGGKLGFVKEISVFVTILETFQNKTEIIPNGAITAGTITNLTTIGNLRVDMPFGIQYGTDIEKAKQIVMDVMKGDNNVMENPAPRVAVNNLGANGVELLALPYSTCDDYWDVYWDTRQRIVEALGTAGYAAPLPQRIVTMKS
ncbi:mechanosensitive ion channel [Aquimarina sp. MMG015]|uniref:mechanosensitive ion channel family protein n=1 Tax=Aquimarina TaxID=290174 RepID=UPI0004112C7A|nr:MULTISPECIES: mechanosensitive ion channel domain-containing protein [Aquimarina]AXT58496.1 mechanosensitive ion channel family protein [Aquimarina sp. AD1]MBQ4805657.1 mechanosensitive ion channel [Aquimarina sp. MMG015]RKN37579.1 mechanosensitive ion channel family protein [Aquimarina sp. AD1]